MINTLRALTFAVLCCFANIALASSNYDIEAPGRVVAFGDVHGAFQDWRALLAELGIIDDKNNWSGGNTHLVSLGDLIDRGPGSRKVVELLMKLDEQAEAAGGAVHLALGNHEVMVMSGDLRYVSRAEYAAFAPDESQADRDGMFAEFLSYNPAKPEANHTEVRKQFDNKYPPGYIALRRAFSMKGHIGRWLIQQPLVVKVNDKVYMHGGIADSVSEDSIDSINSKAKSELTNFLNANDALRAAGVLPWYIDYNARFTFLNARAEEFAAANPKTAASWFEPLKTSFEAQEYFVFSKDSPNWYRGTSVCHPFSESFNTERFLKRAGAKQLVMGHTPTRGEVMVRMDGLAIRLDTGMLKSVYKGRAAALVSDPGGDYIHYLGSTERAQPVREDRSLSRSLSNMSDSELEDFMRTAETIKVEKIGTGVTKPKRVTQEKDGISNEAAFKYEDTNPGIEKKKGYSSRKNRISDRYVYDIAAYKLDRMMGWEMVPTAIIAEVEGDKGALSDWVENAINERDRLEQEMPFQGHCKQSEQYRLRFVFDTLIHNDDRNLTNILWTKDDFMLRFIDHSRAFRTKKKKPKQLKKIEFKVSDLLRSRLEVLNEDNLNSELSEYLHPKQIEAILTRRDLILKDALDTN